MFTILKVYENIDRNSLFSVKEERRTRGHGVTLAKKQCRLDIRTFYIFTKNCIYYNLIVIVVLIYLKIKSTYT